MDVVDRMEAAKTDGRDRPTEDIVIEGVDLDV
jgi:hypothetical protein